MSGTPESILDILVDRLFDYAGMFPPAAKSFEEALRESALLPQTLQRPRMLNTDIVLDAGSAESLPQLDLRSFGFERDVSISLLATSTASQVIDVAEQLVVSRPFGDVSRRINSIELKLLTNKSLEAVHDLHLYCAERGILLALEPDLSTPAWNETLLQTLESSQALSPTPALKCRGSGPTAITPERLARALCHVADVQLPFKVTGGFHHPVVEAERYGNTIGFLNLTVAVMMRRILRQAIAEEDIAALLTNPSVEAVDLRERLQYGRFSLTRLQLMDAKSGPPFSIGSCSLHEPDEDLARLFKSTWPISSIAPSTGPIR